MKAVHLTKITARLERVIEHLNRSQATAGWMKDGYDLPRLLTQDVPELIQAVRDARAEVAEAQDELRRSKEAGAKYQVTVYSDAPMRVSRIEVEQE